jgi:hypothetical protein
MRKTDAPKPNYVGLENRVAPRSDVYFRLSMKLPDSRQDIATCINISSDGLLIRYAESFEPDDILVFSLPVLGQRPAKVIWSLAGKSGIQFDEAISESDYIPLLRAMGGRVDGE